MGGASRSRAAATASLLLVVACDSRPDLGGAPAPDGGEVDAAPGADAGPPPEERPIDPHGCPTLFAQDRVPVWSITLSDSEWAVISEEFLNYSEVKPYHPVEQVTYDDGSGPVNVPAVLIRLKGQSSWVQTVEYDENPKMQFVIAFNEIDPDRRFRGVRKVELDMPRTDWTFLRQRLGLHTMRELGQTAQCANSAILYLNGEYYGLYTHLERLDKEFLQRVYGKADGADDGDLWKGAMEIRTNEETYSEDRIDALWSATSPLEMSRLADLDSAVFEWAAEALLPHADGYYMGRPNFFLYDHPQRGFLWIPSDIDTAFDRYPHFIDLAYPRSSWRDYWFWVPYSTALNHPSGMRRYIDALATVRARIDPAEQVTLIDRWAEQIASAAAADPHRPFSLEDHAWALDQLRDYVYLRHAFIGDWLTCREIGDGDDGDRDGAIFCFDCDDEDPAVHPGADEVCNRLDDDCDGVGDEGLTCPDEP